MTIKTKTIIISSMVLIIFFILGWEYSFSPVKSSIETINDKVSLVKSRIFGSSQIKIPSGYISEIQYETDILHYDLNFDLYPDKKLLKGKAKIKGIFKQPGIEHIDLNLYDNMNISYLSVNGKEKTYSHKGTRLSVPYHSVGKDTFLIEVHYEGKPKRLGLSAFVFGEINGRSVIYNLSEPTFASTWFPCNDIPDDKALADITITNDSVYTSVSNGTLISEIINNGRKTAHWKLLYPISTYLISIYSSEYVQFKDFYYSSLTNDTLPIEYYVFPEHLENARIDFEEHPQMIEFFANTFGEYPFMKEKYGVAEFLWQLGAMEHQTISGIGSNFVSGRKFFNDIYVHELAHHWWGNAVGPKTWKDIWLNEGFSTYSEALYKEHKAGFEGLQSAMLSKYEDNFHGRLYEPGDNLFSSTIYNKGAWALHMLRWEVGDSVFFNMLRYYYEKFKYKAASTEDFKTVCENVSGKNLTKFFNQWVFEGNDQIKMNIEWEIESIRGNIISVKIECKQYQERYKEFHFPVELQFIDKNGRYKNVLFYINEREKTLYCELNFEPVSVEADPDSWLLADFNINP